MSDTMRDASEPWVSVHFHIDNPDNNIENDDNNAKPHKSGSLSSGGGLSTSTPTTHSDAATNITDLDVGNKNINNRDNNANDTAIGRISPIPWFDVTTPYETPPRYDQELEIEDQDGEKAVISSSGTKSGGTTSTAVPVKYNCATQLHGCAAVLVGWESQIQRWCKGSELSYVICEDSFPTKESAALVEAAMRKAIFAWGGVGARFKQVKRSEPATFAIIYKDSQRNDIYADSFFPMPSAGELLIYPLSFFEGNDKYLANILAHEIGHILGLRHVFAQEREAAYPSVRFGSKDAQSVMDYNNDMSKLQVSRLDLEGLKMVYAYDQPVYHGLPVIDVFPKTHTFGSCSYTHHAARNPHRRLSH